MTSLPITNNEQSNEQAQPDLSNPYIYPANPTASIEEKYNKTQQNMSATFESPTSLNQDPELKKIKSSFWKRAGQLQSTIGSWTNNESWQMSGNRTQEEAEKEYRDAEGRLNGGAASRLHGEYDRFMGYVTYAVGHVSGDNDLQIKANQRKEHGKNEIEKSFNH